MFVVGENRAISQDVLAEQIGVSQVTLSRYEKKEKLEQKILEKIALYERMLKDKEEVIPLLHEVLSDKK